MHVERHWPHQLLDHCWDVTPPTHTETHVHVPTTELCGLQKSQFWASFIKKVLKKEDSKKCAYAFLEKNVFDYL